jgi:uroporphyrinogen decarboxylase
MRQAGRYMTEYRKLRDRYPLYEMFRSPELAVEVTLQPVKAFEVDAAIIFSDILLLLKSMGLDLDYTEDTGPMIYDQLRTREDVAALRVADPEEELGFVLEAIRLVRAEIDGKVPLIGFAGAPFTLASYMIEGRSSRNCLVTKVLMYEEPRIWHLLMDKLAAAIGSYLLAQARAGAQALQLFDSWVGCLSPSDYRAYVLPYSRKVFEALRGCAVPCIHFGTGNGGLLALMREAGGDVIGADWRTSLADAWQRVGSDTGIQGNLDPAAILAPRDVLEARAREILDQASGTAGHIFNLGHGMPPTAPESAVELLVDFVHTYKPASADLSA